MLAALKVSRSLNILFVVILIACQSSRNEDQDLAVTVVNRSIAKHGGLEAWKAIQRISYAKTTSLFDSVGNEESKVSQHYRYEFQPELKGQITWLENSDTVKILYEKGLGKKCLNDSLVISETNQATRNMLSSIFVLFQPFKLLDEGTVLTYEGQDTLRNGLRVHVVRADYSTEKSDPWWFYFDVEDDKLVANCVHHNGRFSWIENLTFDSLTGLVLHKHRKSYFTDSLRNIHYLRAEYFYSDYEIESAINN